MPPPGRTMLGPSCPRSHRLPPHLLPVRWEVTPTKAWAASATLGLCPDTCHLNLFLGTSCCQGTLLYGPGGRQTSVPIWPARARLLETPALADNGINLTLPHSHPLNCHRQPQVPRLGTDCIPQGLSTSLTHPWHLTETQGSLAAPLTLPEGIPSIPSCIWNLLCLHGSGRTRQDKEFASRGLKNSCTPVTAGGMSPAMRIRGSIPTPATEPHLSAPCLVQH